MDFHSLVATNLPRKARAKMDSKAEERYYRGHATRPRRWLEPLASIAIAVGLILVLLGVAQI